VFRYRLYDNDGNEQGEVEHPVGIEPGDSFWTEDGRPLRAVDLIATDDDADTYAGLLMVEPAFQSVSRRPSR
jgi:hypothetical protein